MGYLTARRVDVIYLLLIILLSYPFFFFNLGNYSLKEPDEGRYAEIPREMLERGDYIVPHLNYVRYFEKPPLLYWINAAFYKLFGISEWSFRFPNALAGLLCSILLYFFAQKRFSTQAGFFSAVVLISSFGFFTMARFVTIDMLFSGLLFATLICFHEYYRGHGRSYLYLFHGGLALATLAKGPAAPILMVATVLLYLSTERKIFFLKHLFNFKGLLFYSLVAAPWFIAISVQEKEFFHFFFIDQNVMRFLTTRHQRSGPIYYFIPVLAAGMLPWSFFLPRAIAGLWRTRELRLFLIWSAVVLLFFSMSGSKLPPYILPIFPALSLVIGQYFASYKQKPVPIKGEIIFYILFFASVCLTGLLGVSGLIKDYIRLGSALDGIPESIKTLEIGMVLVFAGAICLLCMKRIRTLGSLFYVLCGVSLAIILILMVHVELIDEPETAKYLAKSINTFQPQTALLVNYRSFDNTLAFYTRRRIYVADYKGELAMGAKYPEAQQIFLDDGALRSLFDSGQPILVTSKKKHLFDLIRSVPQELRLLECKRGRCLVTNQLDASRYSSLLNITNW